MSVDCAAFLFPFSHRDPAHTTPPVRQLGREIVRFYLGLTNESA